MKKELVELIPNQSYRGRKIMVFIVYKYINAHKSVKMFVGITFALLINIMANEEIISDN